jgi:hypothetical protein
MESLEALSLTPYGDYGGPARLDTRPGRVGRMAGLGLV